MNIPKNTALMVNNRVYYVEDMIAEKKTAGVWKLKDYSGRYYALKIIYRAASEEFLCRLSVLQKIKYRHFVEIKHCGKLPVKEQLPVLKGKVWKPTKAKGMPFLLTPFAECDLSAFLERELEPRKRISLALQFCLAVRKIHSYLVENSNGKPERFFHGNLKPANILMFPGKNSHILKIADMGITSIPESTYLAPEQKQGVGVNFRCDLFATSKILRKLLTSVQYPDSLGSMEYEQPQKRANALGKIIKELTAEQKCLQNKKMAHNLLLLGIQLYNQGHFQYALKDFDNSLKLLPDILTCLYKGNSLRELGETEQAMTCYQQAMTIDNKDARPFENRGELYAEQKRYREAIEDFEQAIALDPESASIHGSLGMVYIEIKQYQKALEHFDALLAISDDFAPAYVDRGDALMEMGLYQQAAKDYEKALQLKANLAEKIREKLDKARKFYASN